MTVFPHFWPRGRLLEGLPSQARLFAVAPQTQLLGYCHWQRDPKQRGTVVLLHGLEGCSESHYMHGIARKAWLAGFNVIRLNQRNCGGTEHLTPSLYNSGLSQDIMAVVAELSAHDGLDAIWAAGYSMGGNLILKMAGEVRSESPALRGALAVCPNIDPAACVSALEWPTNWAYQRHFLKCLKARLRRKAALFPGQFDEARLAGIRTLREFDEVYTAPDGGYKHADDYYDRAGARHVLASIRVPTVIITAQDDPFIPYHMFECAAIKTNHWIRLWAPSHGGHCGFVQRSRQDEDVYWAENRLVECLVNASGPGQLSAQPNGNS
ncbi:MAG: YheT family hydrolase [Nitrospiraceae bacterium]